MSLKLIPYSIKDTFAVDVDANIKVPGVDPSTTLREYVPDIDPDFVFSKETLSDILGWWLFTLTKQVRHPKKGLYLRGQPGSGKTEYIRQIAARLNIPVFEFTGHNRVEVPDLIAQKDLVGGDTVMSDGPLTMAWRSGGWFLLNEQDYLEPGTTGGMNEVFESIRLPNGERIKPADTSRFICTGNNANADDSGQFSGTQRQNPAFLERFLMIKIDYPSPDVEASIVAKKAPKVPAQTVDRMVTFANEIRAGADANTGRGLDLALSTRCLIDWALLTELFANKKDCNPLEHALNRTFGFRCSKATHDGVMEAYQRVFDPK